MPVKLPTAGPSVSVIPLSANIKPLNSNIVVRKDTPRKQTDAGIYLPENVSSKERTILGTVLNVGDGNFNSTTSSRNPMSVKKGDRVIFSAFSGSSVTCSDSDEIVILNENDILGIHAP